MNISAFLPGVRLRTRLIALSCLLLIALLTFACYYPGLSGPFAFDDGPNILDNSALAIHSLDAGTLKHAALSGHSGLLKRPLSMLTFALNFYGTGFDAHAFKLTNVFIHVLNGMAIWLFSKLLLNACERRFPAQFNARSNAVLCLAVTAVWLLHPLNLTAVLYVVQRMTSLSSLFSILSLCCYVAGRTRIDNGSRGGFGFLATAIGLIPVATLFKENGILLPLFFLVIEFSIFQFSTAQSRTRRLMYGFHATLVLVPGLVAIGYLMLHPEFVMKSYALRNFTLIERLLTESRVIWTYLGMIIYPRSSEMGLFHDDYAISHGLLDPVSTLLAICGLLAMLGTSWLVRRRAPLLTFGLLFFLAGHVLESTILPLELVFEHRNYLPIYGILLAGLYALLPNSNTTAYRRLRYAGALGIMLVFGAVTAVRASQWGDLNLLASTEVSHHPNSPRANLELGVHYFYNAQRSVEASMEYLPLAREHLGKTTVLNPKDTSALLAVVFFEASMNSPIEPEAIEELLRRLRSAPLDGNTSGPILKLVICKSENRCAIELGQLTALLDTALSNPSLAGTNRSAVLTGQAHVRQNLANDNAGAIEAISLAVAASPKETFYRASLVEYLTMGGKYIEARKQLRLARELDVLGENTMTFDALAGELDKAEQAMAPAK